MAIKLAPDAFDFPEIADPANPPAGYMRVYANTGAMMQRDSAGTETALGGGSALPVVDTTAIAKGSVDATKLVRLEVDGVSAATTRVLTVPDTDLTLIGGSVAAGTVGTTDNALIRADGTGGSKVQGSAITVDDNGALTAPRKMIIQGSANEIQFSVRANAGQNADIFEVANGAGQVVATMTKSGGWFLNRADDPDGDVAINDDNGNPLFRADADVLNIGIGTATPDASAKLDITSTSQGFALPRMTESQRDAISSPIDGLEVYNTTDDTKDVRSNGAWMQLSQYIADGVIFTDPTLQTWNNLNHGAGTYTEDTTTRRMVIVEDGDGTADLRGWYTATPSVPYTIKMHVKTWLGDTNANGVAVGFRENATTELHVMEWFDNAADTVSFRVTKWNSPTAVNSTYIAATPVGLCPTWIKLQDDNTNRIISISNDGIAWSVIHSIGRTDFLTADGIFFGVFVTTASSYDTTASLLSYEAT